MVAVFFVFIGCCGGWDCNGGYFCFHFHVVAKAVVFVFVFMRYLVAMAVVVAVFVFVFMRCCGGCFFVFVFMRCCCGCSVVYEQRDEQQVLFWTCLFDCCLPTKGRSQSASA